MKLEQPRGVDNDKSASAGKYVCLPMAHHGKLGTL